MIGAINKPLMLIAVAAMAIPAAADWDLGDGHKMHFPQLPDPNGWDVNATFPKVLADDWMCSATGFVTDIHFWGSWREDRIGEITSLHLSIHDNIPDGGEGYSIPGEELWSLDTDDFIVRPVDPPSDQGWFDPNTGEWQWPDHQQYFQYNVFLPEADWFWQDEGKIYWLDISVKVADDTFQWGWKTSLEHFMDDAVWGDLPDPVWGELRDPRTGESLDMAFVITPAPGAVGLLLLGGMLASRQRRRA